MRALVLTEPLTGAPPVLTERPDPEPGPGEVLVRIAAAALNHRDLLWTDPDEGPRAFDPAGPFVMGADGAGTVAGLGPGVRGWQLGDRVLIDPLLPCGVCRACRRGRPLLCPELSVLGGPADGTLAELVVVPAANLHRVPDHLSAVQAAALPMALGTAWNCLFTAGRLRAGETALIHGIGGGVAQIAAHLAVAAGASVIATSSSEGKLARARELGVAHTVDYRTGDVVDLVRDIVGDEGVDLALDGVGGPALVASLQLAAPEGYGRVVRFGAAAHTRVDLPSSLHSRASVLIGRMADAGEMAAAVAFVGEHRITPAIDDPLSLADALTGLDVLRQGRQNGKVVIEIPGSPPSG